MMSYKSHHKSEFNSYATSVPLQVTHGAFIGGIDPISTCTLWLNLGYSPAEALRCAHVLNQGLRNDVQQSRRQPAWKIRWEEAV